MCTSAFLIFYALAYWLKKCKNCSMLYARFDKKSTFGGGEAYFQKLVEGIFRELPQWSILLNIMIFFDFSNFRPLGRNCKLLILLTILNFFDPRPFDLFCEGIKYLFYWIYCFIFTFRPFNLVGRGIDNKFYQIYWFFFRLSDLSTSWEEEQVVDFIDYI